MFAAYEILTGFETLIERLYVQAAAEVCGTRKEEHDFMDEEGDPPDAHQHVDPMPFDYNLDKVDRLGRLLIRHNYH